MTVPHKPRRVTMTLTEEERDNLVFFLIARSPATFAVVLRKLISPRAWVAKRKQP
jgi:hypothetical protein